MNFFDFFWMEGRPGIFWGVELGALASLGVLFWLFRDQRQPVHAKVETEVEDDVPTALILLTVGLLIAASFLPEPWRRAASALRPCAAGLSAWGCACLAWRPLPAAQPLAKAAGADVPGELDCDTLLLLFSLFHLLEGGQPRGGCHRRGGPAVPLRSRETSRSLFTSAGGGVGGAFGLHR